MTRGTRSGRLSPVVALFALAAAGCARGEPARPAATPARGPDTVSVVGARVISAGDVGRAAERDGVAPEVALRRLEAVALLVAEAEARGLDRARAVRRAEAKVLAQLVLRDLEAATEGGTAEEGAPDAPGAPTPLAEHRLVAFVRVARADGAAAGDDAVAEAEAILDAMEREGAGAVLARYGERPPAREGFVFHVEEGAVVAVRDDPRGTLRGEVFAAPGVGPIRPAFATPTGAYAAYVLAVWPSPSLDPAAARADRAAAERVARREAALAELTRSLETTIPVALDEEALAPVLGTTASSP